MQQGANTGTPFKKELIYDDKVIKKIASLATEEVPGVLTVSGGRIGALTDKLTPGEEKTRGINADVGKKQVALDISVVCEYGRHIPELFRAVTQKVGAAILNMTGLELVELNLHVEDVLGTADFEELGKKQGINVRAQHIPGLYAAPPQPPPTRAPQAPRVQ